MAEKTRNNSTELTLANNTVRETPSRRIIKTILFEMQHMMLPQFFQRHYPKMRSQYRSYKRILRLLCRQADACFRFGGERSEINTKEIAREILQQLPKIKETLLLDAKAIYECDPAARSIEEVMLSYPGFYAISVYRIAHEIYIRKIPFIARIMTEIAHSKTGIDIHAGATIGHSFCIDHGTGIVIGETATIGNNVRIYQGVTLGAKSFLMSEDGSLIKGGKRHPDIGNNCIIYAGATILGGSTVIGDGCVIGGNVWLTHSVPPGQTVYYEGK